MVNPSASNSGFPLSEKKARAQLGLSRDEIRTRRNAHLTEGAHFIRGKQQSVWLNEAGLAALVSTLSPHPLIEKKRADATAPHDLAPVKAALLNLLQQRVDQLSQPITLRVVNCTLKNPHMILACPAGDDPRRPRQTLRVRVNSTAHFVRGMEIPVRAVSGYTDLFELTRKCPRQKGKW